MAENDSSQEKTEQPTPKRLQQAREKGQVPRSKELGTASVLLAAAIGMVMVGPGLGEALLNVMTRVFQPERDALFDAASTLSIWPMVFSELAKPLLMFVVFLFAAAFAGNTLLGGITFSTKAAMPKLDKMSPLKGFKRMFGIQALVELAKGIAKFLVVAIVAYLLLKFNFDDILSLSAMHLPGNVAEAMGLLLKMFIILCSTMLLIVLIDAPYQLWNHNKQLKMTKQEVKDEYKDTEGKPEVKGRIRQLQREISQRKMMGEVPNADVILVNPEHYAVALKYDVSRAGAPFLLAKGVDQVAFKIREIGNEHDIPIVSSPALARAVYYTTKLNEEIPQGLFTAVAAVLAYVMQLKQYQARRARKPNPLPKEFDLPEDLRH
ncbi:flagellar biosynthesis protein FlhB [Paraferrimonas sedimenticola]|uniref:Flagellar biosynthetic protein FlhB n=1 Tax=Paraferrimonas sedimenticola TaxID=375674 RepID=A0AA37VSU6_9GAMM|nr:flagellar biosynthesis protein FlhB [Paraferrimonas sedimenticola]GLP94961.1 flagellar biosynthesis protein FlhB [Paraferrimonas sedimenticola]